MIEINIIEEKLCFEPIKIIKNKLVVQSFVNNLSVINYLQYIDLLTLIAYQNQLYVQFLKNKNKELLFEYKEKDLQESFFILKKSIILN